MYRTEKMNDTCRKAMHSGMVDRGSSVCVICCILKYVNKLKQEQKERRCKDVNIT
jgi:hypothetical protein